MTVADIPLVSQQSAADINPKKRKHEEDDDEKEEESNAIGMETVSSELRQPDLPEFNLISAKNPAKEELGEKPPSEEWKTVERHPKKKAKKIPKAGNGNYPAITFAAKESRLSGPIKIGDLQSLVLYLLADGMAPQFVSIRHRPQFRKVVVLMVPGLEESMFGTKPVSDSHRHSPDEYLPRKLKSETLPTNLKLFADMFEYIWPVKTPGDKKYAKMHSPLHAMLTAPVTKSQENKSNHGKGPKKAREPTGWQNTRTPVTQFLTSPEDLQENGYTLHPATYEDVVDRNNLAEQRKTWELDEAHGWVDTKVNNFDEGSVPDNEFEQGSLTVGREIFAMDCEMCMTGKNEFSLTRISIVGWDGSVVLDELVKPEKPIIDYLTQYSGITEEMLAPVTTTLQDIQKRLVELFHPRTILIGHSLDSDLKALKLTHPYIIDTAVIYPHPRGRPLKSSLKWLAQKYLGKEIQKGHGATGHDSTEDARTCLDLVKLKCEKGSDWGANDSQGENIFKRLARTGIKYKSQGGSAIPASVDGKSSAAVDWGDPKRGPGGAATFSIGCSSDEQIMEGVIRAVNGDPDGKMIPGGGVDFVWGRFRELEDLKEWNNQRLPRAPESKSPAAGSNSTVTTEASDKDTTMEDSTSINPANATESTTTESKIPTETPSEDTTTDPFAPATLTLTQRIHKIYQALPPCTAFIIYSGSGDPKEMVRYQKMKQQFQHEYKTVKWDQLSVKWTDVEEQAMSKAADKARNGVGFIGVK
ncbi:hypothetical protein BCIN_15g01320 [Botrytis cinerea B05.10]|uniref:Exonuclease domain-containing protein n=2 Tax=Botryotinia fuckeliana TaxID=40559 RepID=A0A384K446_BOTFB|nr:hypothetical protein BCIN_15g01320 [Botrytis cinerea B05.10]ATZ57568.1 hypothetical protein BCIN_15g01320 [Botrytis cinerea B05.10]CCD47475.1 similar to RNA exonuclease [Botrytis cinerea T4]